ncbi:MAG: hypothetical protein WC390_09010 [Sulfurimonas sp.]|jgi:hypothetical protein
MTVSVNQAENMKVKRSASRDRNLLNPMQLRDLQLRRSGAEKWLKTHRNSEFRAVREADESQARKIIRRCDELLKQRSAPAIDELTKDKMARRIKYLETKIREGMPSRDEMMGKRHSNPDNPNSKYQEAIPNVVDRHIKWSLANAVRIKEWKRLKRVIEPDSPESTNVENLRKPH